MSRFVLSSIFVLSVLALGGCSGGGSALNFGNATPQRVIVTVAGPTNIANVLPGASLPLSAIAVNGSGNGIVSDNRFIWSAALTTGQQYAIDARGDLKPCASVTLTSGGVTSPYTGDLSIFVTIDPSNEANVLFSPPTILPNPAGGTLTTSYPYCVAVTAQAVAGSASAASPVGQPGSIIVAVFDPQNPLP